MCWLKVINWSFSIKRFEDLISTSPVESMVKNSAKKHIWVMVLIQPLEQWLLTWVEWLSLHIWGYCWRMLDIDPRVLHHSVAINTCWIHTDWMMKVKIGNEAFYHNKEKSQGHKDLLMKSIHCSELDKSPLLFIIFYNS